LISLALFVMTLMFFTAMGVVVGYHRMLTHRAATFVKPLEVFLVLCGLGAGTPVQWVGNHRHHHAHTDDPEDKHSPKQHGFWVAHCGWYLGTKSTWLCVLYALAGPLRTVFDAFWRPRTNQEHVGMAKDIASDPIYAWLSKPLPYACVLLGYVSALWIFAWLVWGWLGVVAMTSVHFIAYSFGDLVNSLGHMKGEKTFDMGDESRDNAFISLIAFGDGWHNSHHAFPGSIRAGLLPGQFDPAYRFTKICEALGLAWGLRVPSADDIAKRRMSA
jgi:fatty-acid desaturase